MLVFIIKPAYGFTFTCIKDSDTKDVLIIKCDVIFKGSGHINSMSCLNPDQEEYMKWVCLNVSNSFEIIARTPMTKKICSILLTLIKGVYQIALTKHNTQKL